MLAAEAEGRPVAVAELELVAEGEPEWESPAVPVLKLVPVAGAEAVLAGVEEAAPVNEATEERVLVPLLVACAVSR